MKKVLPLIIASLFITTLAHAQIEKGSVMLGGNISFGNSKNAYNGFYKHNYVNINPAVGIAVKTNLVAGVTFTYGHMKYASDSVAAPANNTTTGGSVFLRRYFPVAKNFYVYGQGNLGYSHYQSKQKGTSSFYEDLRNEATIEVAPGFAYAVSKKFHLEMGLNDLLIISYGTNKTTTGITGAEEKAVKGHAFGVNTSLSTAAPLYIGFRVFLSK